MSTNSPTIPVETARHVLWHFGQDGGSQPGIFTQHLMHTIATADVVNTAKLADAYPDYTAAIVAAKLDPDGITHLQKIAAGLRCTRCGDTDGPFDGTGASLRCEGCIGDAQ
ncbi:hypothetical protein [Streptomyces sp. NPDC051173]|uniref:hypothetical protein n=1 Tax=Streptomyces sp. NPDC051173 TaxID=3155164 RepID=UPI003450B053